MYLRFSNWSFKNIHLIEYSTKYYLYVRELSRLLQNHLNAWSMGSQSSILLPSLSKIQPNLP